MTIHPPTGTPRQAAPPPPQPAPKRSRRTLFIVLGCVSLAGFLCFSSLMLLVVLAGPPASNGEFQEITLDPGTPGQRDKLVVLSLSGPIMGVGTHLQGDGTVQEMATQMRQAAEDNQVKGVLLQIDSPGGGLTASDTLRHELMRLQKSGKKVVVYVGNMAASGGYWIAAPADRIVASPTSLIGSFGVIIQHVQVEELIKRLGIQVQPLKSTEMKDIGSVFRPMKPEEKAWFEELLGGYHERFIQVIAEGRDLDPETVRGFANGKVYPAEEALKMGLADEIGYVDEALASLRGMTGTAGAKVVAYRKPFALRELLGAQGTSIATQMINQLLDRSTCRTPDIQARWIFPGE